MTELAATIRPARPRDAAAIARVHVETWRAAYPGLVPDAYLVGMSEERQRANWRHWLAQRSGSVLVAEAPARAGLEIVGFGSCGELRSADLPYKGEIYTLYVTDDWQGRGIGRRLLGGLFESLVRRDLPDALLWVLANNPSRFFYEAVGGSRVAERRETFAGELLQETAYLWPDLKFWLEATAS